MTVPPAITAPPTVVLPPDKGWVERLLSPIADVRRGEATSTLLMSATMFVMLAGYYQLKTAREMFILSEGGAEVKSYSAAGQALLLVVLVPLYSAFASRVSRTQLVQWVTAFFVANLLLFLLALKAGWRIGIPFFLWVGIFNVMVIAQFWALAADLYREDQGKRLFPLIGVGSSLGAWLGSVRAGQLMESVGAARLLVSGAVSLLFCMALARLAERRHAAHRAPCPPSRCQAPSQGDADVVHRRSGDRWHFHLPAWPDHARRGFRPLIVTAIRLDRTP